MSLKKILAVSDAGCPTGLARVTSLVLNNLIDHFDVIQLGTNYYGDPHGARWPVYPAHIRGDSYGVNRLPEMLKQFDPDIVFLYNDFWVTESYLGAIRIHSPRASIIIYCPIDGGPVDPDEINKFDGISKFVVCTSYAANMVNSAAYRAKEINPNLRFPSVEIIPHPIDTACFAPMASVAKDVIQHRSTEARRKLFPQFENPDELFIFLNANRNQGRKRIDLTIEAFARFAEDKPDSVKLYLHMGTKDAGWDILKLAKREGIESRILLSSSQQNLIDLPNDELNLIYNSCDVGINTSTSEGWGLTSFEHAATGAAQIVPNHTACGELWNGCAICINPALEYTSPQTYTRAWMLPVEGVVSAMNTLYGNLDVRQQFAISGMNMARSARFSPAAIGRQWLQLFQDSIESPCIKSERSCCC